jgi:CBS domain containing-hemolysin-like protein
LKALDAKSAHAGIVCDEYGGISGMILRQDIYAELVGRAGEDEDGSSGRKAFKSDDGAWIFDGLCPLSFVKESAGWEPPPSRRPTP